MMIFTKFLKCYVFTTLAWIPISFAAALTPVQEIEGFLQKNSKQTGSFIKTSATVEDDTDSHQIFGSECEWSVEKKTFTFKLLENVSNKEVGKFMFSITDGFSLYDSKTKKVIKSGSLTSFYNNFWTDGKLDLGRAFQIKKTIEIENGEVQYNSYLLTPKGALPALALKPVELDLDRDAKKLLYLKFEMGNTAFIWSSDDQF